MSAGRKLSEAELGQIRSLYLQGFSQLYIADMLGISTMRVAMRVIDLKGIRYRRRHQDQIDREPFGVRRISAATWRETRFAGGAVPRAAR